MAFPELVEEISKFWTDENNSKLAKQFSLSRSSLPALVLLSRHYSDIITSINYDREALQNEVKQFQGLLKLEITPADYERQQAELKALRLDIKEKCKIISTMSDELEELREQVQDYERTIAQSPSFFSRFAR